MPGHSSRAVFRHGLCGALLFAVSLGAQTPTPPLPGDQSTDTATDNTPQGWLMPLENLNRALPSWLQFNGQYRNRTERMGGIQFQPQGDTYDLGQFRFEMAVQPVWWITFLGEMQTSNIYANQRIPTGMPYQDTWDIRQAFVKLGDSKRSWFDVIAGRQLFSFGGERVIGPSDWLNEGRTFDAVRLDLRRGGYNLSLFASSVVVGRDGVIDHHIQGNNLHGAYGSIESWIPQAVVEPYVLWRLAPAQVRLNENQGKGALNEVTAGLRVKGKLPAHFDYEIEMARQTGSLGPDQIHAWAGHWSVGRAFDHIRGKPRPYIEANYASGTRNPNSRTWGTFDELYPSAHNKLGFADLIGWRNIVQIRPGIEQTFGRKWKFTETYENFWLASARDGLYASGGSLLTQSVTGQAGRHVGQEVDAWAEWTYRSAIEIGFGYSHFFPGQFLRRLTPGSSAIYPFAYVTYHFTRVQER